MEGYQQNHFTAAPDILNPKHRHMLEVKSTIAPDVIAERDYRSVNSRAELTEYKKYQRRAPSLKLPMYSPCGRTSSQLRADHPRINKDGQPIKYDTPTGSEVIIDVHPRSLEGLQSTTPRRRWVTEGVRKGDALVSQGELAIVLAGVWNFKVKGKEELLPGWDHIEIADQDFYIVFDSDIMTKPEVAQAMDRLARLLQARGARVHVVYMPDGAGGEKVGVDDFLAAGNTIEDLLSHARLYDPADYLKIRLERNPNLADTLLVLDKVHGSLPMQTSGEATTQSVYRVLLKRARSRGKLVKSGVEVRAAVRDVAVDACVGNQTAARHIRKLIESRLLTKHKPPGRNKATYYTIITPGGEGARRIETQWREGEAGKENTANPNNDAPYSVSLLRAPQNADRYQRVDPCVSLLRGGIRDDVGEFRASVSARKPTKKEIRASRLKGTQLRGTSDPVARLGKRRGAIVAFMLNRDGEVTVEELLEEFGGENTRERDFVRRQLMPLTDPPVLEIDGDLVRVTDAWLAGLSAARDLGGEWEANRMQGQRVAREREARKLNVKVDKVPIPPQGAFNPVGDLVQVLCPRGCACVICQIEFGKVIGEHVEGCNCQSCHIAHWTTNAPTGPALIEFAAPAPPVGEPEPEPVCEDPGDPFCDCKA